MSNKLCGNFMFKFILRILQDSQFSFRLIINGNNAQSAMIVRASRHSRLKICYKNPG